MRVPFNDLKRAAAAERPTLAEALNRVLDSGWYILGEEVRRFESSFATHTGARHAVTVANGTDALELALRALRPTPGIEVITAANAGMYASTAIRRAGMLPAYADVDDATMNLDTPQIAAVLTARTGAVIVTHLYGRLAPVEPIIELCRPKGIPVIEDCAQAHGAARNGRRAGSFGDLGCFSFYPTKNLGALGDAGAVVTGDERLARRLLALRQYGWRDKYHVELAGGVNSRMDEMQAAILNARLPSLESRNARRRSIAARYGAEIRNPLIVLPHASGDDFVAHLYVVRCADRDSLRKHLADRGVSTDVHYPIPDHRQSAHAGRQQAPALPVTERLAREVLSLPCFPELVDDEIDAVIDACSTWPGPRA